jgi:hypothetical protein
VTQAGGRIYHNRVGHPKFNPQLMNIAVSRAIGDAGFKLDEFTDGKKSGLIAEAEMRTVELVADDEFLVIGCDGLWDVITYQDSVDLCRGCLARGFTGQQVTEFLVQEALNRNSSDNVTVMFVNLRERGATPLSRNSSSVISPNTAASTAAAAAAAGAAVAADGAAPALAAAATTSDPAAAAAAAAAAATAPAAAALGASSAQAVGDVARAVTQLFDNWDYSTEAEAASAAAQHAPGGGAVAKQS